MAKGIKRQVNMVHANVSKVIAAFAQRGGRYSSALASEGYNGGYRDALSDVILALNGVHPDRNGWWDEPARIAGTRTIRQKRPAS